MKHCGWRRTSQRAGAAASSMPCGKFVQLTVALNFGACRCSRRPESFCIKINCVVSLSERPCPVLRRIGAGPLLACVYLLLTYSMNRRSFGLCVVRRVQHMKIQQRAVDFLIPDAYDSHAFFYYVVFASNRIVDRTNRGQTWTMKLYETSRDTDHAMKARLIIVRTDDILHPVTNSDALSSVAHTECVLVSAHRA